VHLVCSTRVSFELGQNKKYKLKEYYHICIVGNIVTVLAEGGFVS
jgi:hypothetical protein